MLRFKLPFICDTCGGRLSPNDSEEFQSPNVLIEAELSRRRALLKASIAEAIGRFFTDFREDEYWVSEKELHQVMVEDLSGSGIPMEWV